MSEKHVPRMVLIEGPPGIGKTALLNEAVRYVPDWWRANVYLDPSDLRKPGYAATHLLRKPERYRAPSEPEELAQWVQATVDAVSEPIVVVMEDLQWADDLSTDIIYQVIREVEDVPMFNLVTMRSNDRQTLRRFVRLARTEGEAIHLVLRPFGVEETADHLRRMSGLPVGTAVASAIHEMTDGFPQFVEAAGQALARGEMGRGRAVGDLAAVLEGPGGPAELLAESAASVLETEPDEVSHALALLSASLRPMTAEELTVLCERAVGVAPDMSSLRSTGLLARRDATGRFALAHRVLAEAVLANWGAEDRAAVHLQLTDLPGASGPEKLRHRSRAARLSPKTYAELLSRSPADLAGELVAAAEESVVQNERAGALSLSRSAVLLAPSETRLCLFTRSALSARHSRSLREVEGLAHDLPITPLRQGILARIHLDRGDTDAAFFELERLRWVHAEEAEDVDGLLTYADSVAALARAAAEGVNNRFPPLVTRTVEALREAETLLELQQGTCRRADLINVMTVLRMWDLLAEDPVQPAVARQEIEELLGELEGVSGTGHGQTVIRAVRGGRLRQHGDHQGAVTDLERVVQNSRYLYDGVAAYARTQLCLTFFDAGFWDEAAGLGTQAAEEALADGEGSDAVAAYSISALVPCARGEGEPADIPPAHGRLLDRIRNVPTALAPMAHVTRHYALAWAALARRDHHTARSHLLRMIGEGNLWRTGAPAAVLLGRSAVLAGRCRALAGLIRTVESSGFSAEEVTSYVLTHLRGLQAMAAGEPMRAMELYGQAWETVSLQPPLRPSLPRGDGGGLRLYRALLGMDMARCLRDHSESLAVYAETTAEAVTWAGAVFRACGADGLAEEADELLGAIDPSPPVSSSPQPPRGTVRVGARENGTPSHSATHGESQGKHPGAQSPALPEDHAGTHRGTPLDPLTARERQIALLVSQGLTNRAVAGRLVVSVRTVEYHVANALTKLQLASRHDLRRVVVQAAQPETRDGQLDKSPGLS